jgi:Fur family transcriptional regulator, ferric uptake regulator
MGDERLERILDELRSGGGRVTTARRALVEALLDGGSHLTADDLAARVQVAHPEVHRSTVYRTLDALERLGVVVHSHLGHGGGVYHLADEQHQHLVCEGCGTVVEVPDDVFAPLAAVVRRRYGFTIEPGHFVLVGRCRACRA